MLETIISDLFEQLGFTWTLENDKVITPTDSDVERVLDEAARQLHNEPIGTRLNVGKLIVEKRPVGHDVYLFTGNFQ